METNEDNDVLLITIPITKVEIDELIDTIIEQLGNSEGVDMTLERFSPEIYEKDYVSVKTNMLRKLLKVTEEAYAEYLRSKSDCVR